jgi:hypothetical protein
MPEETPGLSASPTNEKDISQPSIRRLRPGLYRRLLCEVTLPVDSPLAQPDAGQDRAYLFGNLDEETRYNPLLH